MDPRMDPRMDPMDRRGAGSSPGMMGASLGPGSSHHRSRSATRSGAGNANRSYHSLDRDNHDREFMPIRETRDGRGGGGGPDLRDRSLERGKILPFRIHSF